VIFWRFIEDVALCGGVVVRRLENMLCNIDHPELELSGNCCRPTSRRTCSATNASAWDHRDHIGGVVLTSGNMLCNSHPSP
jgi:hypothetical protein